MNEPTFDADGYPTDETLQAIRDWSATDEHALMRFVERAWKYGGIKRKGKFLRLATGGWSGNESIVGALQDNYIFWAIWWYMSKRGGLHVFSIPPE